MNKIVKIIKIASPVDDYRFNCQIWTTDGCGTRWYSGNGKFFKTKKEAKFFKKEIEA